MKFCITTCWNKCKNIFKIITKHPVWFHICSVFISVLLFNWWFLWNVSSDANVRYHNYTFCSQISCCYLCRNVLFYYGTGVTFGLLASLLIVVFVISRFIPKVVTSLTAIVCFTAVKFPVYKWNCKVKGFKCSIKCLEQSACWRPVCLVTHNISSKAKNSFISENSFILAILPRHCFITALP